VRWRVEEKRGKRSDTGIEVLGLRLGVSERESSSVLLDLGRDAADLSDRLRRAVDAAKD